MKISDLQKMVFVNDFTEQSLQTMQIKYIIPHAKERHHFIHVCVENNKSNMKKDKRPGQQMQPNL
jgi:hypothetical protein